MGIYSKKFAGVYNKNWNDFSVKVFNVFKKDIKNKRVCDVACGTGNFIKLAKRVTKSICGIDISKDFVEYAREANPEISFRVIDVENWRDKNKYDVVVCFYDSVNHFDNWERAFKNIYQSLKKDGKFIFDINSIRGLKNWHKTYLNKVSGGYIYMKGQVLSDNRAKMTIEFFNKNGLLVDKGEVVEKTYLSKEIIKILKSVGFGRVRIIDKVANLSSKKRIFFECTK